MMIPRRKFLQLAGAAGATLMLPRWALRNAHAQVPTIMDPLYTAPILDAGAVPQFVNALPVVQALGLRRDVTGGGNVGVRILQTTQDLLGGGFGLNTDVWGYQVQGLGAPATYPGATFLAMSGVPVTITWNNRLGNAYLLRQGANPAADVVDITLHWAYGPGTSGGTFPADGIPVVTHLHGGHTDSAYDGLPEQWFSQTKMGADFVTNVYTYDNSQEGATLWYHDHALGITRTNVYAGLAGFYLLRDANENQLINTGAIPSGDYEIEMVIQDRMFYPDGRLAYPDAEAEEDEMDEDDVQPSVQPEFFGQIILVNGKAWPFLEVEPRQYRFRLLNGSDSRFYNLSLPGVPFLVIGNDGGLLNFPVRMSHLTIGPGERYDVVLDFSARASQTLVMTNNAKTPFPAGETVNPRLDGRIMAFNVALPLGSGPVAPVTEATDLRPVSGPIPGIPTGTPVRSLMLFEGTDQFGRLQPLLGTVDLSASGPSTDGTFLWDDPTTEMPALGSTEIWEVHNATEDAHPIHLHLVQFQILNRQRFSATVIPKASAGGTVGGFLRNVRYRGAAKPPGAYEAGFKDTAIMYPGEVTRVVATFDKPGQWVWHCHILSHEDHEMMRRFVVS